MSRFTKATKKQAKLRLCLCGPSGSGKTFTALRMAKELGQRIALIDTERESASLYSDDFDFDACPMATHAPQEYVAAIKDAEAEGYDVVIIDSLSHAWSGRDGALEQVDKAAKRSGSGNSFTAWRDITPVHNELVDTMLSAKMHVIATLRTKTEYVVENVKGKSVPRKVGMAPIQRDGMEYEFTVVADLDQDHNFVVTKTRCSRLGGYVGKLAGEKEAKILKEWLEEGEAAPTRWETAVRSFQDAFDVTEKQLLVALAAESPDDVTEQDYGALKTWYAALRDGRRKPEELFKQST